MYSYIFLSTVSILGNRVLQTPSDLLKKEDEFLEINVFTVYKTTMSYSGTNKAREPWTFNSWHTLMFNKIQQSLGLMARSNWREMEEIMSL